MGGGKMLREKKGVFLTLLGLVFVAAFIAFFVHKMLRRHFEKPKISGADQRTLIQQGVNAETYDAAYHSILQKVDAVNQKSMDRQKEYESLM
jgi:hypothetical protein